MLQPLITRHATAALLDRLPHRLLERRLVAVDSSLWHDGGVNGFAQDFLIPQADDAQLTDVGQSGVAALSGTAFGAFGEGYLRFSVANSLENLQRALERIGEWTTQNL